MGLLFKTEEVGHLNPHRKLNEWSGFCFLLIASLFGLWTSEDWASYDPPMAQNYGN